MQIPFLFDWVQRVATTTVVRCNLMSTTLLNRKQQHWLICSLLLGWRVLCFCFFSPDAHAYLFGSGRKPELKPIVVVAAAAVFNSTGLLIDRRWLSRRLGASERSRRGGRGWEQQQYHIEMSGGSLERELKSNPMNMLSRVHVPHGVQIQLRALVPDAALPHPARPVFHPAWSNPYPSIRKSLLWEQVHLGAGITAPK